ncbi:MAG: antiviral reverse transcriptase Drt3a, partial [Marinoscillum sp.]
IKSFAAEGTPYKVHKFDIKSFFEGIQIEQLENKIEDVRGLSRHTKKLLCRGMHYFHVEKGCCVPRGIETSGILSDLYLREFDEIIRRDEGVFFYSRFVDDILIFTDKGLDSDAFKKRIGERLPEGLGLNDKKYDSKTVPERKKAGDLYIGKELAIFNYLGFEFRVIDTPLPIKKVNGQLVEDGGRAKYQFREVRVDLSGNKVKRTKEKICKSFYSYYKNKNYELLKDRLRLLTSNREMVKKDDSVIIPIGVYYNSSACDYPSTKLSHLDSFMRYLLSGSNDRLPKLYSGLFSRQERSELLKFSFSYGFRHRVHRRFSYNRMAEIVKVWK